jgi:hypothetical protein
MREGRLVDDVPAVERHTGTGEAQTFRLVGHCSEALLRAQRDFFERDIFVFVSISALDRQLDYRIEDEAALEVGTALQQPRPGPNGRSGRASRSSDVHLEICDADKVRMVDILRPAGIFSPVRVRDGNRVHVGTIAGAGSYSHTFQDALNRHTGTITRDSRGGGVDYAIEDVSGTIVGSIADLRHIQNPPTGARRWFTEQPAEHVLEIIGDVGRDLRIMMLGSAAAVYLTLQRPVVVGDGDGG